MLTFHDKCSLFKSSLRIVACAELYFHNFTAAAALLLIAEVAGILEEYRADSNVWKKWLRK
jgi:hypothetical protein